MKLKKGKLLLGIVAITLVVFLLSQGSSQPTLPEELELQQPARHQPVDKRQRSPAGEDEVADTPLRKTQIETLRDEEPLPDAEDEPRKTIKPRRKVARDADEHHQPESRRKVARDADGHRQPESRRKVARDADEHHQPESRRKVARDADEHHQAEPQPVPVRVETEQQEKVHVETNDQEQEEQVTPNPPPPPPKPTPQDCFIKPVYFQAALCSRASTMLDMALPANSTRKMHVAHVGSFDAHYRLGEFIDVFEKNSPRGTLLIRDMLNPNQTTHSLQCGLCCECVSASEKTKRSIPFEATLFEIDHRMTNDLRVAAWSDDIRVVKGTPSATHSRLKKGLDVLSLDAGDYDITLIEKLVLSKAVEVRSMLQFTAVNPGTNYSTLMDDLKVAGFTCYLFTAKATGRSFRGIRIPSYPVAVRVTDCWRPQYNSILGDTFQFTCVNNNDSALMGVLNVFAHRSHRSGSAGCLMPHRLGNKKALEQPTTTAQPTEPPAQEEETAPPQAAPEAAPEAAPQAVPEAE